MGCGGSKKASHRDLEFRLLPFATLKAKKRLPIFPGDFDDTVDVSTVRVSECLVVYLQYEPDSFNQHQVVLYHMAVQAIEKVRARFLVDGDNVDVFVFLDVSCQYDDLSLYAILDIAAKGGKNNRAKKGRDKAIRGSSLYGVMQLCDCMISLFPLPVALAAAAAAAEAAAGASAAGKGKNSGQGSPQRSKNSDRSTATPERPIRNRHLPVPSPATPTPATPLRPPVPPHSEETKSSPSFPSPTSSSPSSSSSSTGESKSKWYGYPHSYLADDRWHSWLGNPWTRLENLFCARVPILYSGKAKAKLFKGALGQAFQFERRLHLVYAAALVPPAAASHSTKTSFLRPSGHPSTSQSSASLAFQPCEGTAPALMVLPYFRQEYCNQLAPVQAMTHSHHMSSGRHADLLNHKIMFLLELLASRPVLTLSAGVLEPAAAAAAAAAAGGVAVDTVPSSGSGAAAGGGAAAGAIAAIAVPSTGPGGKEGTGGLTTSPSPTSPSPSPSRESRIVVQVLPHGAVYSGQLDNNGRYSGTGSYCSSGYDCFTGTWSQGCLNGQHCVIEYNNGDVYRGAVERNMRHGYGCMDYEAGGFYHGEWKHGVKEGDAKSLDVLCDHLYVGSYVKGLKHGQGTQHYTNGSTFIGDFRGGLRHGPGKLIRKRRVRAPSAAPAETGLSGDVTFIEKEDEWEVHEGTWFLDKLGV